VAAPYTDAMKQPPIRTLVDEFVDRLQEAVRQEAAEQAQQAVSAAFGPLSAGRPAKSKPAVSAAPASSARQLHGRYIGKIRNFKGAQKKKIQAERANNGAEAAIRLMDSLA
jgi:hypothetical protein